MARRSRGDFVFGLRFAHNVFQNNVNIGFAGEQLLVICGRIEDFQAIEHFFLREKRKHIHVDIDQIDGKNVFRKRAVFENRLADENFFKANVPRKRINFRGFDGTLIHAEKRRAERVHAELNNRSQEKCDNRQDCDNQYAERNQDAFKPAAFFLRGRKRSGIFRRRRSRGFFFKIRFIGFHNQ